MSSYQDFCCKISFCAYFWTDIRGSRNGLNMAGFLFESCVFVGNFVTEIRKEDRYS